MAPHPPTHHLTPADRTQLVNSGAFRRHTYLGCLRCADLELLHVSLLINSSNSVQGTEHLVHFPVSLFSLPLFPVSLFFVSISLSPSSLSPSSLSSLSPSSSSSSSSSHKFDFKQSRMSRSPRSAHRPSSPLPAPPPNPLLSRCVFSVITLLVLAVYPRTMRNTLLTDYRSSTSLRRLVMTSLCKSEMLVATSAILKGVAVRPSCCCSGREKDSSQK